MQREALWEKFEKSGKIEDYLAFKSQKDEEEKKGDLKDQRSDNPGTLHG